MPFKVSILFILQFSLCLIVPFVVLLFCCAVHFHISFLSWAFCFIRCLAGVFCLTCAQTFLFKKIFLCILYIFFCCIWLFFHHLSFLSVVDSDPDPTFEVNLDPDTEFWWPKIEKKYRRNFCHIFFIKNCNLLAPWLPYRTSKLQEKPLAFKIEHPALQKIKFINFFSIFMGHFCPPVSESGSGWESWSRDPIESGSNPDPDPQHCFECFLH